MKKFFAMTLCVIMVFGLVACDSNPGVSISEGGVFTQPEETTVMSREDAVKVIEKRYKAVIQRTEEYSCLVNPDIVLDNTECSVQVMVIDNCGEMSEKQKERICTAMLAANTSMPSDGYVGLVYYGVNPSVELPITKTIGGVNERAEIMCRMEHECGDGGGSMFDAMIVGLKMLVDAQGYVPCAKMSMIVLSNGRWFDARYEDKIEEIVSLATGMDIRIYVVVYDVVGDDLERLDGVKKIAEDTGGVCVEVDSGNIVKEFKNLTYDAARCNE